MLDWMDRFDMWAFKNFNRGKDKTALKMAIALKNSPIEWLMVAPFISIVYFWEDL